jgi:glycosyltransferase involved in cell wall biosynthesis
MSAPLHIVLVGDYPADDRLGSPKALLRLRDALREQGHRATTLLAPDLGPTPRQRHLRDAASPWLAARAIRALAARDGIPDVIDASSAEGLSIARSREGAWSRVAVAARSHGLEHRNYARMLDDAREGFGRRGWHRRIWYPAVRMRAVAASARRADALILLNEGDRAFALERRWVAPEAVHVIPHGLASVFLDDRIATERGGGLLFCGSWDRAKGIDYLVRAFEHAAPADADLRLTVLGPGIPASSVLAAFADGVRRRVRVVDRVAEAEVAAEYRRHDALVMCSTYEGFGMVVPEAMSQGLPVIATPVGAARALVRDGETGVLVPPRDAPALAIAMLRVIRDAALRARLAGAAIHEVCGLTWAASAARTVEAYRDAIARRERSTGARAA